MGVLTDFVALEPGVAAAVDAGTFTAADHAGWAVASTGVFVVELATLEELLTGTDSMDILVGDDAEPLSQTDDGAQLFLAVRPSLVDALSADPRRDWAAVAQRWVATDELAGADPGPLAAFLGDLAALAERALAAGRRLYVWASV